MVEEFWWRVVQAGCRSDGSEYSDEFALSVEEINMIKNAVRAQIEAAEEGELKEAWIQLICKIDF